MMASEKFCLKWNNFEANISSALREIREDKEFVDVTLASEDDELIQAHKVIIGACSPFFRNILRRHSHSHPLLYLKGVKHKELVSVLNFMYTGEVSVAQQDLNSFLAVAQELRVKGLTQGAKTSPIGPQADPAAKRTRPNPPSAPQSAGQNSSMFQSVGLNSSLLSSYQDDITEIKSEPGTSEMVNTVEEQDFDLGQCEAGEYFTEKSENHSWYQDSYCEDPSTGGGNGAIVLKSKAEADNEISSMMVSSLTEEGKIWLCSSCNFSHKRKDRVFRHVDQFHYEFSYNCEACGKISPTLHAKLMNCKCHKKEYPRTQEGSEADTRIEYES